MADTKPLAPTDAEIIALADATRTAEGGANGYILPISFARAVLARWGQPAHSGEQVDRADAVNLARNTLTQYDCAITKKGVRVLAEAVLSMDAAINAARKQGANHD